MLAAGYIAGLLAGRWLAPSVVGSQSTVERVADAAYGDRLTMWADALRITWSSPLTGVGVGEYGQAQYWLARPTSELIGTPYAHNAVLQFAAEFGVIAGIAFAALCLWWLLGDWTRRRASPALVCVVAMVALLGGVSAVVTFVFMALVHQGTKVIWEQTAQVVGLDPRLFTLLVCTTGGLLVGLLVKLFGDHSGIFAEVMLEFGKTGRFDYRNAPGIVITALVSLISGASLGPEAPLADPCTKDGSSPLRSTEYASLAQSDRVRGAGKKLMFNAEPQR